MDTKETPTENTIKKTFKSLEVGDTAEISLRHLNNGYSFVVAVERSNKNTRSFFTTDFAIDQCLLLYSVPEDLYLISSLKILEKAKSAVPNHSNNDFEAGDSVTIQGEKTHATIMAALNGWVYAEDEEGNPFTATPSSHYYFQKASIS